MHTITMSVLCSAAALLVGCEQQDRSERGLVEGAHSRLMQQEANDAPPIKDVAAGFVHHREASRMYLGTYLGDDRSFEFQRVVGTDGVLAYGNNGVLLGVPNADSKARSAPPFKGTGDQHTEVVRDYFLASGIPQTQLGATGIDAEMESTGSTEDQRNGKYAKDIFRGYASVLYRQVESLRVEGSYAWAQFNANNDVVTEEVFWPALDKTVVEQGQSLKAKFADPRAVAEFLAKVPEGLRGQTPEVILYHSPHFQATFEAYAAVAFPGSSPLKFNAEGEPVSFVWEKQALAEAAAAPERK